MREKTKSAKKGGTNRPAFMLMPSPGPSSYEILEIVVCVKITAYIRISINGADFVT